MTAEDRNRRAKWGHDIPRSWISDFNMTHPTDHLEETEEQLIERVRAKAKRQRMEDLAAQRAATQRRIEQTLFASAACIGLMLCGVVAVAAWQLMPPVATPQQRR